MILWNDFRSKGSTEHINIFMSQHVYDQDQEPNGFDRSRKKAEDMVNNPEGIKGLLAKALSILQKNPGNLKGFIQDIGNLIRLIRAYFNGTYTEISPTALVMIIAGLIYLVNPFDVVPDFLLGIGFLDDATVLGFVILKTKNEIQRFVDWEMQQTEKA